MQSEVFFNALKIALKDEFEKLYKLDLNQFSFEFIWQNFSYIKNILKLKINEDLKKICPEKEFDRVLKNNVQIILYDNPKYPNLLKEIYRPPMGLYVKGNIDLLNSGTNLSIIGSRKSTNYGKLACEKIINGLKGYNINIVSGLALGIDSLAHTLALNNNLKTLAYIGSGFNFLFPALNKNLSEKIIKNNGAVVSEYPINFSAQKYYFVSRNRLISGSSKAILIIEAQEKSGTLITAKFANEQNRDILVVPNSIFEKNSKGTNKLIKEGAILVESAEDILMELGLEKQKDFNEDLFLTNLTNNQKNIIKLFEKNSQIDLDFIAEKTSLEIGEIMSELTILELAGIIKQIKNNFYIKIL